MSAVGDQVPLSDLPRFARWALALAWSANRNLTLIIIILTVFAASLPAAAAYVGKLIIDGAVAAADTGSIADRNAAMGWAFLEALILASLLAIRRVLKFCRALLHVELGYGVSTRIFDKALTLDLTQLESPDVQQKILLAKQHATSRPYNLVSRIVDGVQYSIMLLSFAVILWTFSPLIVALMVLGGLPVFFGELSLSGTAFRFYMSRTPEMRERAYLETLLTSDTVAPERLHYGTGPQIRRRYAALFGDLFRQDRRIQARRTYVGIVLGFVSSAIFLGAKIWVVLAAAAAAITIGQMAMFVALIKQGQGAASSLLTSLSGIYDDLLYASNLQRYLDLPEHRPVGDVRVGPRLDDGVRFERVGFRYPNGDRDAVCDVTLHIPPGARVGVVGANGSGKSTLVKLLTGLYRPSAGRITLDGADIDDWDRAALRARLGVLFQPFVRFKMTAGENIAMGGALEDAGVARLEAAAERGLARELLGELPDGLETRLSRRFIDGRELSGGQWQRLALSRALLNEDADVVVLDEPTSALDPAAEAEFIARVWDDRRARRTMIMVSHRLANIRNADQIIVLDHGRVAEMGDHAALMSIGGIYGDLFTKQSRKYSG